MKPNHSCYENIAASYQGGHVVMIFCTECGKCTEEVIHLDMQMKDWNKQEKVVINLT